MPDASLADLCAGPVLTPGDDAYTDWLSCLPSSVARARQPLAVVLPSALADVQKCVSWARTHGKTITVVGGGHSAHCLWDGALAVDLRRGLGEARLLEGGLLEAGGGASLATITNTAEAGGRMCIVGTAPSVGAGLLLQGGVGHLARWRGLAVDAIEALRCVTPDAQDRFASRDREPELFWALCGAGPNLAVVTQIVLRTFSLAAVWCSELEMWLGSSEGADGAGPDERTLLSYAAAATRCREHETMDAMLHWSGADADASEWRLCLAVSSFEWEAESVACEGRGQGRLGEVQASGGGGGRRAGEAGPAVRCARPSELFARERYLNTDPGPGLPPPAGPADGAHFWVRCAFLRSPLPPPAAAVLCSAVRAAPNRACYINLQHAGGAAAAPTCATSGAFSNRGWEWSAVVTGVYRASAGGEAVREWVQSTVRKLLPFAVGTYNVDLGPEDGEFAAHAFDKRACARLRALKLAYDPCSLLAHALPLNP